MACLLSNFFRLTKNSPYQPKTVTKLAPFGVVGTKKKKKSTQIHEDNRDMLFSFTTKMSL